MRYIYEVNFNPYLLVTIKLFSQWQKTQQPKKVPSGRERQHYYGKTTLNAIRQLLATKATAATAPLPATASMIDKLASRGAIDKNRAAGLKIKLA